MTLLSMLQDVADEIGVARPTAIIDSTDQTVRTLLGLANKEGAELAERGPWQELITEETFSTANGTASYALSTVGSDYDRMLNDTIWNRTTRRPVGGPLSPQGYQADQASGTNYPFGRFRIQGGNIIITPTPTSVETVAFEYISDQWCQSSGSVGQTAWTADDDTGKISESLMADGIIWRWLKRKGFEWEPDERAYQKRVDKALGRSGSAPTLGMASPKNDGVQDVATVTLNTWADWTNDNWEDLV